MKRSKLGANSRWTIDGRLVPPRLELEQPLHPDRGSRELTVELSARMMGQFKMARAATPNECNSNRDQHYAGG